MIVATVYLCPFYVTPPYWNTVRLGHVAARWLATPDKIMRMNQKSFLLLRQGRDPLVVGKIRYYTGLGFVRFADPA